jgi:phenylalanyl-tRNA synthetase beta chain
MDIKITDKALRHFLQTKADPETISNKVSLCGPTFDRVHKENGQFIYDIEIITNRIDTASVQGIAREASAILNQQGITAKLTNDPYRGNISFDKFFSKTFAFDIQDKSLTPRFVAVSFENVSVKDSPDNTKELLQLCGERPINNIVDITNELTLLYGMPCHAFDLDKLAPQKLTLRQSKKGEIIKTLDNQICNLKGGDIIIEDGANRIVDLSGVMGGAVAEIDAHTKNILFIVPVYNPQKVRKTSLYLQKRTIASQIYEKQPDPEMCLPTLSKAIQLLKERSQARPSSSVFDFYPAKESSKTISLDTNWLNTYVGIEIPNDQIISILDSLGFKTKTENNSKISCTVPSWRHHDINIKEDLVEEISRIYGYFKLPSILPYVNLKPEAKDSILSTESKIKYYLFGKGFNEVFNSSLISRNLIETYELDTKKHLKLTNALSKDYEYLRTSLVPSITQNIKNNQGKVLEPINIFEIANTYHISNKKTPDEISHLVFASTQDYRHTKGILESMLENLFIDNPIFVSTKNKDGFFSENTTADIFVKNEFIGRIGNIKPNILRNMNISTKFVLVEISVPAITKNTSNNRIISPLSEYPEISECITINSNKKIGEIIDTIFSMSNLINKVQYQETYESNHTFKVSFLSTKENLTQKQVDPIKEKILKIFS